MDANKVYDFINKQPKCSFATLDGDKPKIRMFWTWFIDDDNIYFHTPKNGNAYRQMLLNQNVELCYFEDNDEGKMIRISGVVHFINNDKTFLSKLLEDRPFLKELSAKLRPEDVYGIFYLKKSEVLYR